MPTEEPYPMNWGLVYVVLGDSGFIIKSEPENTFHQFLHLRRDHRPMIHQPVRFGPGIS